LAAFCQADAALDPATRTLLTPLEVDNARGQRLADAYAEERFRLPARADVPEA
jgi:hypothetical protein